ncbi:MAG: 3'-5' exoribonuclease YhaM family protein [Thermoanaerobaculia bacterium]
MTRRKNEPIAAWQDGDAVAGFALLARKELRQDRTGKGYLDLELADASGSIIGKVWSDSPALEGDFESHDFIAFEGTVKNYRNQLQVSVTKCRRAAEDDRRFGFDETRLIPTTKEDIGELWRRLEGLLDERIGRPVLRELAAATLAAHGARLREHPAAKTIHHAYRGGLLEHVVSMAELAVRLAAQYPELDLDLLLVGVLFHDLGKLDELGAMPANDYTEVGRLVGHVVLGRDLLRERCAALPDFPAELQLALEHLVLSHQGELEFGSPVEPMTAEAIALHFIDDLDSKINQLRRARDDGGGLRYLRGFGRYLVLPPTPGKERADAAEEIAGEAARQGQLDL